METCRGKSCFHIVKDQRSDEGDAHPCPYIEARYGKADLCRCCDTCTRACAADIKESHG